MSAGIVAAGNPHTAKAAAEVLAAGGNAVDAILAGAMASFLAEPLMTGAGGGGILTVAMPGKAPQCIDFFSAAPLNPPPREALDFAAVEVVFDAARQVFHVGRGSAAMPLVLPGLALASECFGRLPLSVCAEPAIALAREGCPMNELSAKVFGLLWDINSRDPQTASLYADNWLAPTTGQVLRNPQLADLLEDFVREKAMPERMRLGLLEAFGPGTGGGLTAADMLQQPQLREPEHFALGDWKVHSSPRAGGRLLKVIATALAGAPQHHNAAQEVLRHAEACRAGHRARQSDHEDSVVGSTTHLSIIDAQGGAAAMTLTNGEGCGHLIPNTGVQLNNFLGEEDLNPQGFFAHGPGAELPSMIAPTIAQGPAGLLVLGSGGSNRIRSVVAQVLYRVALRGETLDAAVAAPRVHAEEEAMWLELADRPNPSAIIETLEGAFDEVSSFPFRDFFFGGVNAVFQDPVGRLSGVGDARRGGDVVLG